MALLCKGVNMKKQPGTRYSSCASCELERSERICLVKDGKGAVGCPTLSRKKVLADANREFESPDTKEFARQASIQEAECYANRHQRPYIMQPNKTRLVEVCEFSERMGYKRLGLAFCIGLRKEAKTVSEILTGIGFDVVSAVCKAGRTPKELIGIREEEKIFQGTEEAMCNPVYQARLLNHEKVEFNILLGLCVGHDSLFFKYADAPTTVLAVKDRVTGHNPLAPVYLVDSYYGNLRSSKI